MGPSALRIEQARARMSLIRPRVLWAKRPRRRGLRAEAAEVSISWNSSTPPRVVLPFSMLKGNLRLPKVLDVAPNPANDLVLESTQGKLQPTALSRCSANLLQEVLRQLQLQLSSNAPQIWVSKGTRILIRGGCPSVFLGNTLGLFPFALGLGPG